MEAILTRIYTQEELIANYQEDDVFIDFELKAGFKEDNPGVQIISSVGSSIDNGDNTFTYTLTIQYED